jgi:hypothetical protein
VRSAREQAASAMLENLYALEGADKNDNFVDPKTQGYASMPVSCTTTAEFPYFMHF